MEAAPEFAEKPATHDHQPRLNEVAQKFLADLDEERQRLSSKFPLCALLIDEGKINSMFFPTLICICSRGPCLLYWPYSWQGVLRRRLQAEADEDYPKGLCSRQAVP